MCASPDLAYFTSGALIGSRSHGEEAPLIRDALQRVLPAVVELESRSRNDSLYGLRYEHFARTREIPHARRDVDGDAADILTHYLHLARMQSNARFESDLPHRI